jgi:hypothetical protein
MKVCIPAITDTPVENDHILEYFCKIRSGKQADRLLLLRSQGQLGALALIHDGKHGERVTGSEPPRIRGN